MALMQAPGGPSPGQTCALILIFTVLLQALCVAVTYVYFTNELKQVSTMRTLSEQRLWATLRLTAFIGSSGKTLQRKRILSFSVWGPQLLMHIITEDFAKAN